MAQFHLDCGLWTAESSKSRFLGMDCGLSSGFPFLPLVTRHSKEFPSRHGGMRSGNRKSEIDPRPPLAIPCPHRHSYTHEERLPRYP